MQLAKLVAVLCLLPIFSLGQDAADPIEKAFNSSDRLFQKTFQKSEKYQSRLDRATIKYLRKLQRTELKLIRRVASNDSALLKELLSNANSDYLSLNNVLHLSRPSTSEYYDDHLDTLKTTIRFIKEKVSPDNLLKAGKFTEAQNAYEALTGKLGKVDFIEKHLVERQRLLKEKFSQFGFLRELRGYQNQIYYYRAQIAEYKQIFQKPDKLEVALLRVANNVPAFQKFFNQHSQLAALFRMPGGNGVELLAPDEGLQTRAMVMQELDQRLGMTPEFKNQMRSGISDAKSGLEKAKNKIGELGTSGSDFDMPGFKPNDQKSKSFFKRFELGTNIQSNRGSALLPVSTDIGLSLGYRLNSKAVIGIGSSYRAGLGENIRNFRLTHEGVGLRSFFDVRIKGGFWATGGAEMNYRSSFNRVRELQDENKWQRSVLAGITKKYQISKKVKGNIQLLYDFLSSTQVPPVRPLVVRVGYTF